MRTIDVIEEFKVDESTFWLKQQSCGAENIVSVRFGEITEIQTIDGIKLKVLNLVTLSTQKFPILL